MRGIHKGRRDGTRCRKRAGGEGRGVKVVGWTAAWPRRWMGPSLEALPLAN